MQSYANAVLSSFEDPEKILDQAVLEMNDDLIKMRQATAQVSHILMLLRTLLLPLPPIAASQFHLLNSHFCFFLLLLLISYCHKILSRTMLYKSSMKKSCILLLIVIVGSVMNSQVSTLYHCCES